MALMRRLRRGRNPGAPWSLTTVFDLEKLGDLVLLHTIAVNCPVISPSVLEGDFLLSMDHKLDLIGVTELICLAWQEVRHSEPRHRGSLCFALPLRLHPALSTRDFPCLRPWLLVCSAFC